MVQVLIDGAVYKTVETAEEAAQLRASLRRWASTSVKIETRPVEPVAVEVPPVCVACGGTGEYRHYGFRKGAWVPVAEPCPRCRPPLRPAA